MPDPSERQLLADAIRGELLTAHHGAAEVDELVERVLDCIDAHPLLPVAEQPKVCPTCANSGWVGSRSNPSDCPTCGRKPYFLNGGTYPAPPQLAALEVTE